MKKFIIVIAILTVTLAGLVGYLNYKARHLPDNRPSAYLAKAPDARNGRVVVCAGDSITHAAVSCNYIDILASRNGMKNFMFLNAGINSELAYNLLQRADEIAACAPEFVTILIGTNDVNATLLPANEARYIKDMKLPRRPDREWYRANLREVCAALKSRTKAKIALFSLPPIGEQREDTAYLRARDYSTVVRETAAEMKFAYLPLNERIDELLRARGPSKAPFYADNELLMYKAIVRHYMLGTSWDGIADSSGFVFVTDFLHLSGRGALLAADLAEGFIAKN
ncbi:MAG: SGNH/GDSL hydrolase family protein [Spirochaetes bacterium]|nr:MAG: SGNH/GDSL hydrolase family protein [Spirochaetota bacterium]